MKHTALIPHPAFSPAAPLVTAREIMLAALCAGLKAQVIDQAEKITRLEEDKRSLTRALHRTACAGSAIPELLAVLATGAVALTVLQWRGSAAYACFALGFFMGLGWMVMVLFRTAPARTTARHRQHPAHIDEPVNDAQILEAIRRRGAPLGEAYAGEVWSEEPGAWTSEPLSHPEALTRQLNEAIHHPAAEEARARFEATTKAIQTA